MRDGADALAADLTSEGNIMANLTNPQKAPTLKKSLRVERAQDSAKTAKLRALRLAKEQADKEAADKLAAEKSGTDKKPARRKRAKPPKMLRLIY